MSKPYIVVGVADAQLARVTIARLYAASRSLDYPMPGPTLYVWDPRPNAAGDQVAFGPCDTLDGDPSDVETWCLGQPLTTELGTLTMPAAAAELEDDWFPPPVILE